MKYGVRIFRDMDNFSGWGFCNTCIAFSTILGMACEARFDVIWRYVAELVFMLLRPIHGGNNDNHQSLPINVVAQCPPWFPEIFPPKFFIQGPTLARRPLSASQTIARNEELETLEARPRIHHRVDDGQPKSHHVPWEYLGFFPSSVGPQTCRKKSVTKTTYYNNQFMRIEYDMSDVVPKKTAMFSDEF